MRILMTLGFISLLILAPQPAFPDPQRSVIVSEKALLCGAITWPMAAGDNFIPEDMQVTMRGAHAEVIAVANTQNRSDLPLSCRRIVADRTAAAGNHVGYFAFVSQRVDIGGQFLETLVPPADVPVSLTCAYRHRSIGCNSHTAETAAYKIPSAKPLYLYAVSPARAEGPGTITPFSAPIAFTGQIAYVTDRQPAATPPPASRGFFGNNRAAATLQLCGSPQSLDSPSGDNCYMSYGEVANGKTVTPAANVSQLYQGMQKAYPGFSQIVVFVNGFNHSFLGSLEDAEHLSAQLDPPFLGANIPVLIYSWPTPASNYALPISLLHYAQDDANNSWTRLHFQKFLSTLLNADPTGRLKIDLVAHSMGNQIMLSGLLALRDETIGPGSTAPCAPTASQRNYCGRIGQVVSFEPDVDMQTYAEQVNDLLDFVSGVTIYGSTDDLALWGSAQLHQDCRAGQLDCKTAYFPTGVNVIDATALRHCDPSSHHSYWAVSNLVLNDLATLFAEGVMKENDPSTTRVHLDFVSQASGKITFPHYEIDGKDGSKECR